MGSSFDTWSVLVSVNVVRLAVTVAVAAWSRLHKTYSGFHHWVAGMGMSVVASFLTSLYPFWPGPIAILANAAITLGILLLLDGTRRFVLDRPLRPLWYALPLCSGAACGVLHYGFDSFLARVWWQAGVLGAMGVAAGLTLLRHPRTGALVLYRAGAWLCLLYPVLLVLRAVAMTVSSAPAVQSLSYQRPSEALFFLFVGVLDMNLLTVYLTLNSERVDEELRRSQAEVKMLSGILPICARCNRIRDEDHGWTGLPDYVARNSEARFSHGVCPDCFQVLYPEYCDPPRT